MTINENGMANNHVRGIVFRWMLVDRNEHKYAVTFGYEYLKGVARNYRDETPTTGITHSRIYALTTKNKVSIWKVWPTT